MAWKTGRTAVFESWFLGKQRLAAWLAFEVPRLGRSSSIREVQCGRLVVLETDAFDSRLAVWLPGQARRFTESLMRG